MNPLDYNIKDEFEYELNEIEYYFNALKNRRVYELSGVQSDGTLQTCADSIKKYFDAILNGIQTGYGGKKNLIGVWVTKIKGN